LLAHDRVFGERIGARYFAARVDGAFVGCCQLYERDGAAEIENVDTLEEYRGRGAARAVITTAIDAARADGADLVVSVVPTQYLRGVALRFEDALPGNMAIVMVLTSLVLAQHGHSLGAIAFSHMFHTAGMFAFTIPLGKLADRFGRGRVMFPGVAIALLGAVFVTFGEGYWPITLGTFLVGLGWAAANVAATALIADQAETVERGRAIGVNDSFAGATSVLMALVTGPMIERSGLPAAGLTAVLVALPPLLLGLAARATDRGDPVPETRSARE